jgi:hypothetical protein
MIIIIIIIIIIIEALVPCADREFGECRGYALTSA